jgi:PAS domain S-box-containing protein
MNEPDYRQLIDALPQIVWTAPPEGQPDYFNQRWFEYTGLTLAESRNLGWRSLVHHEDLAVCVDDWQAAIAKGSPFRIVFRLKRASDGAFRWHLARGNPLRDREGRITRWVGTCADIDERAQAEQALKRTAAELARSNAELAQFAAIASHDLQEPLRMVVSATQLLVRDYKEKLDPEIGEWLTFALEGAKRMQLLINALLDYSRLNLRDQPSEPVDCQTVCQLALANLKVPIQESGAIVTVDALPHVQGNEAQLLRLFQNLLANAVKFRGPDQPRINVSASRQDNEWHFAVRDNGIGIDPRHFKRLFVLFQRLHAASEYPGTGLGLAICKKIVEQHGGRIWVESAPGHGATFYFTLPVL